MKQLVITALDGTETLKTFSDWDTEARTTIVTALKAGSSIRVVNVFEYRIEFDPNYMPIFKKILPTLCYGGTVYSDHLNRLCWIEIDKSRLDILAEMILHMPATLKPWSK